MHVFKKLLISLHIAEINYTGAARVEENAVLKYSPYIEQSGIFLCFIIENYTDEYKKECTY